MITDDNSYTRRIEQQRVPLSAEDFIAEAGHVAIYINACLEFPNARRSYHESFSEMMSFDDKTCPKDFLIGRVLHDVLRALCAQHSWCLSMVSLLKEPANFNSRKRQATVESIIIVQNLFARKLFEASLFCRLLAKTNQEEYYKHLLLLFDLDSYLSRTQDFSEFFEKHNGFLEDQSNTLRNQILELEIVHPHLKTAWYLFDAKPAQRLRKPGKLLASTKTLFKLVARDADVKTRVTMGHSYQAVFGSASKKVHFTASLTHSPGESTSHDVSSYSGMNAALASSLIESLIELLGSSPGKICSAIVNASKSNEADIAIKTEEILLRQFSPGDHVTFANTLLKVLETHSSTFGLISCNARPIAGQLKQADWFPSSMLTLFSPASSDILTEDQVIELWKSNSVDAFHQ